MRKLGVTNRATWLLDNKIMQVMCEHEKPYALRGMVWLDDAYLGGERKGGSGLGIREQDSDRRGCLLERGWPSDSCEDQSCELLQFRSDR